MKAVKNDDLVITTKDDGLGDQVPLLHFPIGIVKATETKDVKWDTAAPSGASGKQQYRDEATGEVFEKAEIKRGVRVGDVFHEVDPEAIKAVDQITTLADMRVETAMPFDEVDFSRGTGLYFLQAAKGTHKVYHLIYRALLPQAKGKKADKQRLAMRVKFSIRTRQKLGIIYADPQREVLMMTVLAYAEEVREPDEALLAHKAAQVEQVQIDKARKLITGLIGKDESEPVDEAIALKQELMEQAATGEAIEYTPIPESETVSSDNLEALLDASLV